MKYFSLFSIFLFSLLWSAKIEKLNWGESISFTEFLQNNHLPTNLYYDADDETKKNMEDIQAGSDYYLLTDENSSILQVLIPISEELQIHIYKRRGKYYLESIPIEYIKQKRDFVVRITGSSVFNDIKKVTNYGRVAEYFVQIFKNRVDFNREIYKHSIMAMIYYQKFRLGLHFGGVELEIAMLQTGRKKKYVLGFEGVNYDIEGKRIEKNRLIRPLQNVKYWISSKFTKRRWHPILKKYRAHLGVDYAAPTGTPVYATTDGKIVFAGWSRGYGKTVKIQHGGGYLSLYAHMSKIVKGVKIGSYVKQGEKIGEVGSTGLSTGPHLHFGLYHNGVAIDPEKVVAIKIRSSVPENRKKEFFRFRDRAVEELQILLRDFKDGKYRNQPYERYKLYCEASISNVSPDISYYENNISNLENSEKIEDNSSVVEDSEIQKVIEEYFQSKRLHLYIPPGSDEFELSEEYMEY